MALNTSEAIKYMETKDRCRKTNCPTTTEAARGVAWAANQGAAARRRGGSLLASVAILKRADERRTSEKRWHYYERTH